MKRNTPLITLLVGAALGVVLLISNVLATPSGKPVSYSAAAASAASVPATAAAPSSPAPAATESSPASSATSPAAPTESSEAPAESSPAVSEPASAPSPEPTRTTPTKATYTARVGGGGGSVAVAVHGSKAIAYVCNGSTVEGWMGGKVENGKLSLTGQQRDKLGITFHVGSYTPRGPAGSILRGSISVFSDAGRHLARRARTAIFRPGRRGASERPGSWIPLHRYLATS